MEYSLLIVEVIILVGLSAICSGLNIALMSLDIADLRRKKKLGNASAKRVLPLRRNGHLSLAAILFTNVAVVSATSLILEHRFNGLIAGFLSTILIVVFGEVLPQAWFTRYALTFTALFAPLLRLLILLTYPLSKPLQLLLDKLFGHANYALHTRRELGVILTEHVGHKSSELDEDEVEIMRGALSLSEKRVRDIMTPIRHVYFLTSDMVIDDAKIDEIKNENWSRIPVLTPDKRDVEGILLMKDLVDIDFDEQAYPVSKLPLHPTISVGPMTALDTMFRKFISGHTHMIIVEQAEIIVGIITIEDLIEEILGHEIEDESDQTALA